MLRKQFLRSVCGAAMLTAVACSLLRATEIEVETSCVVRELDEVRIPARRAGMISELSVRRGDYVIRDQRIGTLDPQDTQVKLAVALAKVKVAELRAANDSSVAVASAAVEKGRMEDQLLTKLGPDALFLEKFRAENALASSVAELAGARERLAQESAQVQVEQSEVDVLKQDLTQLNLLSPFDGIVRDTPRRPGEWVQPGDPIAVVTRLDRLLIEGFVDAADVRPSVVTGMQGTLVIPLAGGKELVRQGLRVQHADSRLELDGKYTVWIEIANEVEADAAGIERWILRPGMHGRLTITTN